MDNHSNGKRKKILLLGEVNSHHFQKWIVSLASDYEIKICSLVKPSASTEKYLQNVDYEAVYGFGPEAKTFFKLRYFSVFGKFKKAYKTWQPDIVHAHYATSYGLLAKLMKPKALFVSVWGSDIFDFPNKSRLHQGFLSSILNVCTRVFSTSYVMKSAAEKYTSTPITVIPFGVDTERFIKDSNQTKRESLRVGMVKMLEHVYGIDLLIETLAQLKTDFPDLQVDLYGSGSQEQNLRDLATSLGVEDSVHFHGRISNHQVPEVLNDLDVYCAFSRAESFGVSAVEANACELPVLATKVNGLLEVIKDGENGLLVESNVTALADGLRTLLNDRSLREKLGKNGRKRVLELYDWNQNVQMMKEQYESVG